MNGDIRAILSLKCVTDTISMGAKGRFGIQFKTGHHLLFSAQDRTQADAWCHAISRAVADAISSTEALDASTFHANSDTELTDDEEVEQDTVGALPSMLKEEDNDDDGSNQSVLLSSIDDAMDTDERGQMPNWYVGEPAKDVAAVDSCPVTHARHAPDAEGFCTNCGSQTGRPKAPSLTPASPLPEGWEERADPTSGTPYYFNATTGVSVWDRPQA